MNALAFLHRALVERQQARYGVVGIFHPHQRGLHGLRRLEVLVYQHNGRAGGVEVVFVLRIGKKGDGSLFAFFYFGKRADGGVGITLHRTLQIICNLLSSKLHVLN